MPAPSSAPSSPLSAAPPAGAPAASLCDALPKRLIWCPACLRRAMGPLASNAPGCVTSGHAMGVASVNEPRQQPQRRDLPGPRARLVQYLSSASVRPRGGPSAGLACASVSAPPGAPHVERWCSRRRAAGDTRWSCCCEQIRRTRWGRRWAGGHFGRPLGVGKHRTLSKTLSEGYPARLEESQELRGGLGAARLASLGRGAATRRFLGFRRCEEGRHCLRYLRWQARPSLCGPGGPLEPGAGHLYDAAAASTPPGGRP